MGPPSGQENEIRSGGGFCRKGEGVPEEEGVK